MFDGYEKAYGDTVTLSLLNVRYGIFCFGVKLGLPKYGLDNQYILLLDFVFMSNRMNVAIISSREYLEYALVLVKSIQVNHTHRDLHVYILTADYSDEYLSVIRELPSDDKKIIDVLPIDIKIFDSMSKVSSLWPRQILATMVLNTILPKDVDRCICLEVDTIVDGDISELYDYDISEYVVAGAPQGLGVSEQSTKEKVNLDNVRLNPEEIIFEEINAGVMLFNVELMRKINVSIESYDNTAPTAETAINRAFRGRIMYFNPSRFHYRVKWIKQYYNLFYVNDRKIIHYLNDNSIVRKPWTIRYYKGEYIHYASPITPNVTLINAQIDETFEIWWKYAEKSYYYNDLVSKMKLTKDYHEKITMRAVNGLCSEIQKSRAYVSILAALINNGDNNICRYFIRNKISRIALFGSPTLMHSLIPVFLRIGIQIDYVVGNEPLHGVKNINKNATMYPIVDLIIVCDPTTKIEKNEEFINERTPSPVVDVQEIVKNK